MSFVRVGKTFYSPSRFRSSRLQNTTQQKNFSKMAYRTFANSNEDLIEGLKNQGLVSSPRIEKAMLQVDRANFVKGNPYIDVPQPIGDGQTISAPHMHAMCLELLKDHLKEGSRALDVGSGSGYLSACFAHLVAPSGKVSSVIIAHPKVIGIDIYPELIKKSKEGLERDCPEFVSKGIIEIKLGDGWKGDPDNGPFDAIHVGAGADKLPQALVDQLKPGGRLVVPVGPTDLYQELLQVDKDANGHITKKRITDCRYVPLQHVPASTSY